MSTGSDHLVGILGGMGPAATADFYTQLIRSTPATCDQEHLNVAIWADPRIPDRVPALLEQGADVYPWLLTGAHKLRGLGATIAAMPCNTAHYYLAQLVADTQLPFVDMVAETVAAVIERSDQVQTVGLLGTRGTLQTGLYQQPFAAAGLRTVEPDPEAQRLVDLAIRHVKSADAPAAQPFVEEAARRLSTAGDVVVLACTELPVALRDANLGGLPPLIDPTTVLARAVVRECLAPTDSR